MFKHSTKGAHLFISFIIFLVSVFSLAAIGPFAFFVWLWSVYELTQALGKAPTQPLER